MNAIERIGKLGPYEWLVDYIELRNKIDSLIEKLSEGRLTCEQIPVLKKYISDLIQDEAEIINYASNLDGSVHLVLKLKYIDGLTFDEIQEKLNVSRTFVAKRHSAAVKIFEGLEGIEEQLRLFRVGTKRRKELNVK